MKSYLLLISYVAISWLLVEDFHPFSRYPMYSSFPNWGYVFFLKNEKDSTLFINRAFGDTKNNNTGYISHHFYSLCNTYHYYYGDGKEKTEELRAAGKEILQSLLAKERRLMDYADTLKLNQRFYFLKNNQLSYRDRLMYEIPTDSSLLR